MAMRTSRKVRKAKEKAGRQAAGHHKDEGALFWAVKCPFSTVLYFSASLTGFLSQDDGRVDAGGGVGEVRRHLKDEGHFSERPFFDRSESLLLLASSAV